MDHEGDLFAASSPSELDVDLDFAKEDTAHGHHGGLWARADRSREDAEKRQPLPVITAVSVTSNRQDGSMKTR